MAELGSQQKRPTRVLVAACCLFPTSSWPFLAADHFDADQQSSWIFHNRSSQAASSTWELLLYCKQSQLQSEHRVVWARTTQGMWEGRCWFSPRRRNFSPLGTSYKRREIILFLGMFSSCCAGCFFFLFQNCQCRDFHRYLLLVAILVSRLQILHTSSGSLDIAQRSILAAEDSNRIAWKRQLLDFWLRMGVADWLYFLCFGISCMVAFSLVSNSRLCAWMHQWHPLIKPIYEG